MGSFDVSARFETKDGSRPEAAALGDGVGSQTPLVAFAVLAGGGDAFEGGPKLADSAATLTLVRAAFVVDGGTAHQRTRVHGDIARMLEHNAKLRGRVQQMKKVSVHIVDEGGRLSDVGFPRNLNESAAGVFWDQPAWPTARIGLVSKHLDQDPVLVVHETAHALHRLAFTRKEQKLVDDNLLPVWGHRAAVDEVFAIYSEREFLAGFGVDERQAPGIYGATRRQWSDDHLFTRFVRKLYFPHKPLAGTKAPRAADWKRFLG